MWRLLLLSAVCGCVSEEHCAPASPFLPGTFVSSGGHSENGDANFPHARAGAKTLVLERTASGQARVTISYLRAGKQIVEIWEPDDSAGPFPWAPQLGNAGRDSGGQEVKLSPSSQDFGTVELGSSALATFVMQNLTGRPSGPHAILVQGPDFISSSTSCVAALPPDGRCTIDVEFRPTSTRDVLGTLMVQTGITGVSASLTGRGGVRPEAAPIPDGAAGPPADAGTD